jgi:DedD protein
LDTQLKQRLTGAVILVALAVLLVPEILSGPPAETPASASTAGGSAAATTASGAAADGSMRSYAIDLSAETGSPMTPVASMSSPPAPTPNNSDRAGGEPMAANSTAEPSQEGVLPPAENATASAAERETSSAPAARESARARAPDVLRSGTFAVQVGSFGNRDNAERLVRDLQSKGFPAYLEAPTGGRNLVRVRVGPVEDRAAAVSLVERLKRAGQPGAIVPNS